MSDEIDKQITGQQMKSLWLWFTKLANTLNESGLDMRVVLKPTYSIPWTKESVHDHIWLPLQKALYGTDSTTYLHKIEQINKIHEIIMREFGEKHGLEFIPFPCDEERQLENIKHGL